MRSRGSASRCRGAATVAALLLCGAIVGAGCGRSAPEGAVPDPTAESAEPLAAGIRVFSDHSVVPPSSTTAPPAPTVSTTSTSPAPTGPSQTYVIKPGDTLSVIAEQFGISMSALSEANNITDVDSIRPGQELIIPAG